LHVFALEEHRFVRHERAQRRRDIALPSEIDGHRFNDGGHRAIVQPGAVNSMKPRVSPDHFRHRSRQARVRKLL
jgi:hypothetical protein